MNQGTVSPDRWWNIGAAVLAVPVVLLWLAGYGPGATACRGPVLGTVAPASSSQPPALAMVPAEEAAATVIPVAPVAPAPAAPAEVVAEAALAQAPSPDMSTVYFAQGKSAAPANTDAQLAAITAFLKDNPDARVALAGFHDPKGSLEKNQQLAFERARAVSALLEAAGIAAERIELRKPEVTTGSGSNDEARRVEISVER